MKKIFLLAMVGIILTACGVPSVDTTTFTHTSPASKIRVEHQDTYTGDYFKDAVQAIIDTEDEATGRASLNNQSVTELSRYFAEGLLSTPSKAFVKITVTTTTTRENTTEAGETFTTKEIIEEFVEATLRFEEATPPTFAAGMDVDTGALDTPMVPATYDVYIEGPGIEYRETDPNGDGSKTITYTVDYVHVPYDYYTNEDNPDYSVVRPGLTTVPHTFSGTISDNAQTHTVTLPNSPNRTATFPVTELFISPDMRNAVKGRDSLDFGTPQMLGLPINVGFTAADNTYHSFLISFDTDLTKYYMDRREFVIRVPGLIADSTFGDADLDREVYEGMEYKIWVIE